MSGTIHSRREGEHVVLLEIDNPPRNTLGTAMRGEAARSTSAACSIRSTEATFRLRPADDA